jgi:hypothetical protein
VANHTRACVRAYVRARACGALEAQTRARGPEDRGAGGFEAGVLAEKKPLFYTAKWSE